MFLRRWETPATRVPETELGSNHLADGSVRSPRFGGIGVRMQLQLGRVDYLDLRDRNGNDDAADGDGGLWG